MPKSLLEQLPESVRSEVPGASPDFRTELAAQLAELVPEAVADGKIDAKKLAELLGDDAADESERFGLFWPGKKRALRAAQAPTSATLKPDFANSKDWDTTQNVFIEGDNLEVLKILQRHYHNKIKLIYIDPPYNTGKDFVYPDNFTEGLETYLEWTRQVNEEGKKVSTNSETEGRYHSNWLNMMYPRLKLARNLLTDDGVIFISIDDNEQDSLKKLCNEVFGESNFIGQLTWESTTQPDNIGKARFGLQRKIEYILFYAKKNGDMKPFILEALDGEKKSYPHTGRFGNCRFEIIERAYDGAYARPTMRFKILGQEPRAGKQWQIGEDTAKQLEADGKLEIVEGVVKRAVYPEDDKTSYIPFWSHLSSNEAGTSQRGKAELYDLIGRNIGFDTVKPTQLLRKLLKHFANDAVVLDFFAGSATTAHAMMQLNAEDGGNRRFIMVQLPEPTPEDSEARKAGFATIADISRKRIELAGEKIGKGDTGFRAYKLTDTNFAKWRVTSDVTPTQLEQHLLDLRDSADDGASQDDLLTELLLKLGLSLTETIATRTIAGLHVREVGDNRVLAYVDEHHKPTLEQLRALVDTAPGKLIVLEDAFHGDDQLKTNLAQYAKTRGIELRTA